MNRRLSVISEVWPIRGGFRIARGAKDVAEVVVAEIADAKATGRGECVPYARYGETIARVIADIEGLRSEIENGLTREALQTRLPAGAARNALDCALLDWQAKATGIPVHRRLSLPAPQILTTLFTLSLDTPEVMAAGARDARAKGYDRLKLKVTGRGDIARVDAVRRAAPNAVLVVDANEAWRPDDLADLVPALAERGVALIEQPLPAGADAALAGIESAVGFCADESCHTRADLAGLAGRYSHINVKLDKAGGLTEALALVRAARAQGFGIMVGCMVATSLSMAPASLLGSLADYVDLDGPLLLARDRRPGLDYHGNHFASPPSALWG